MKKFSKNQPVYLQKQPVYKNQPAMNKFFKSRLSIDNQS